MLRRIRLNWRKCCVRPGRSMKRVAALSIAILAAVLLVPVGSFGQGVSHKIDHAVAAQLQSSPTAPQRVIITTLPASREAIKQSLTARGNTVVGENSRFSTLTANVAGGDITMYAGNAAVTGIHADAKIVTHAAPGGSGGSDSAVSALRETLGLSSTTWTGAGIGIAVIDSGVKSVTDFSGRLYFFDFLNGAPGNLITAADGYGHGTHVAGLIGSTGASSSGQYKGVAPGARLVALRALDANGQGYTSDVINAINFAITYKAALGIDIINLSLGHPIFEPAASDPLVQAVEAASRAGIIVVAAAGNVGTNPTTGEIGYAGVTSPGNARSAITVGAINTNGTATRSDDTVPNYSSRGPTWDDGFLKPDLVAPGHKLVSDATSTATLYKNNTALRVGSNYMTLSGTSMSTGVVSGTVALMLQANRAATGYPARPSLTPNAVKAILQYTAFRMHDASGAELDSLTQGAGALNAAGAIELAKAIDTSAAPGAPWLMSGVTPTTTIAGENILWGENVLWGENIP